MQLLGCVHIDPEAAQSLIELGKEEKGKEETLAREEKSFKKVSKAIRRHHLKIGISGPEVMDRFGEPVLIHSTGEGERWVYKTRQGSWFNSPKIYLFFDETDHLKRWICIRMDCARP